ncbi:hypothetical protein [Nonomuraea cavernae]|uniref:hypothetical protein n=1 Tax=Nonomuraea cavernae TaxID=2045107 RepID=UPI00340F23AC
MSDSERHGRVLMVAGVLAGGLMLAAAAILGGDRPPVTSLSPVSLPAQAGDRPAQPATTLSTGKVRVRATGVTTRPPVTRPSHSARPSLRTGASPAATRPSADVGPAATRPARTPKPTAVPTAGLTRSPAASPTAVAGRSFVTPAMPYSAVPTRTHPPAGHGAPPLSPAPVSTPPGYGEAVSPHD